MRLTIIILFASLILISCNEKEKQFSQFIQSDKIELIEFQGADMDDMNTTAYKKDFIRNLSNAKLSPVRNFKEGTHFFTLKIKDHQQVYTAKINQSFVAIDARAFGEKALELKSDSSQFEIVWEMEK